MSTLDACKPIAVGGVSGSGTRVVARILMELGIYMGGHLNGPRDNLWFALLVVKPRWLPDHQEEIIKGLQIFRDTMLGRLNRTPDTVMFILRAFLRFRSPRDFLLFPPPYYAGALASLLRAKHAPPASSIGWGWKLPETYLFLPYVKAVFPKVKYIHVIRHGLDMAYSRNQHQFWAWGAYFGIRPQRSVKLFPKALLQFWLRANEWAIAQARSLLGGDFLLLNFDELCRHPDEMVRELARFIGIEAETSRIERACQLIRPPRTQGRYRSRDLSIFDPCDLDAVRRFGFEIKGVG